MVAFAGALAGCESGVKITSISPDVGTIAGGEDVILNGSGFKTGLQVKFGGAEAKNVVIMGSNQIKANTPANHKGPCDVTVTFDDGRAFKIANAFRYADPSELMKRDMLGKSGKAPEGKAEGKAEPKK
jgi:hypothetical protein